MSSKKPFLKVETKDGERTRKVLLEYDLLDMDFKIFSQDGELFIPLRNKIQDKQIDTIMDSILYEIGEMEFEQIAQGPKNLTEALESYLSPEEIELVPRA